jgi:fatty acyl-CoA reductase
LSLTLCSFCLPQIFDKIRQFDRNQLQKVRVIKGDVTEDDLGLCGSDCKRVTENVDVVFHCAANVRFDQQLKDAVNFNTRGTLRMLQLATEMKNLKAFVHVSTSYCQCNEDVVEERAYMAPQNPYGILEMTKLLDNEILDLVTPRLLNNLPNTYAYTKALTEELVTGFSDRLPVAIGRPSIVCAAVREPMPGWVEGLNGPTGLMIGAGRGVLRSMHCNKDYNADLVPVDVAINTTIALAWERGNNDTKETIFCNIVASPENMSTWGECLDRGRGYIRDNPFNFALWYPDGSIKSNYYYHMMCVILFHILPAYFIDTLLFLLRKKRLWVTPLSNLKLSFHI